MENQIANISKKDLIRMLIDNTPVAYIVLDNEYRIHFINENFIKLRKLNRDEVIGNKCYNISNKGRRCQQCAVNEAITRGKRSLISRKDILQDGTVRFIDDYAIPLDTDSNGDVNFILEIMVNRTREMQARERRNAGYDEILSILSALLDAKDEYTATHSAGVRELSHKLATEMGLSAADIFDISVAASLHDIGKVKIPDAIINKKGKLTDEEFAMIKRHPAISYEMLEELSSFKNIKNIVRHHHERIDGRGYPDGLKGDEISLGAKIVAVADTYDAITSARSYKKAFSHEFALEEIARVAGTQLDRDVVRAFIGMDFGAAGEAHRELDGPAPPVERVIEVADDRQDDAGSSPDISMIDDDKFLNAILDNTPCGYVLMDVDKNVLFASNYFLDYMGLSLDEVVGKKCYEAGVSGQSACPGCAIDRAILSGNVEYMRQEQDTRNGRKIFDLFGMPMPGPDGRIEHVIEVILDRTEEVKLERRRENDFKKLIAMLTSLLEQGDAGDDNDKLSAEIILLRRRLNELLKAN